MKKQYGGECSTQYLYICGILLVTFLLTANILAVKFFEIYGFKMGGGFVVFPFALIMGDIVTEVYGFKNARRVIFVALISYLFYMAMTQIMLHLPPAHEWHKQSAFEEIFSQSPRIFCAGVLAYLAGELSNSFIMSYMKSLNNGQYFWSRAMVSTVIGELCNSVVFMFSAFGGKMEFTFLLGVIMNGVIIKTLIEALVLPVTYIFVRQLKRAEGVDYFESK